MNEVPSYPVFITDRAKALAVAGESGACHELVATPPEIDAFAIADYLDGAVLIVRYRDGEYVGVLHPERAALGRFTETPLWLFNLRKVVTMINALDPASYGILMSKGLDAFIAEYKRLTGGAT